MAGAEDKCRYRKLATWLINNLEAEFDARTVTKIYEDNMKIEDTILDKSAMADALDYFIKAKLPIKLRIKDNSQPKDNND